MPPRLAPLKIRAEHLDRQALIYVRQSTPMQVRDNIASTARQYDLARRAEQFGWPKGHIHVIDQDQGHSGASTLGRDGFQYLMAEVGLGRVGAVLSLEASRLARSCSDWYRLIEICGLTDTLVIDEDGVYDPTQYNDRLLLGIKGTMSEAELHWIRSRLLGGQVGEGPDRRPPLPTTHGAGLRPRRSDRPRSRRAGAAGAAPGLRHLRAGGGRPRGGPGFRRESAQLPHPPLRGEPRRPTGLATTGPRACPGHPPQSEVHGYLCLWTDQDPQRRLARRGAPDQRADASRRRRGLAVRPPRPPSRLHHLGAIPAESTTAS